jgi:hypothetical protein
VERAAVEACEGERAGWEIADGWRRSSVCRTGGR